MARVLYDGKLLQPVQSVNIQKQYTKAGDGENIGSKYSLTVNGTLIWNNGSPKSDRSFWTSAGNPPQESIPVGSGLPSILRKIEAVRELFATEGKTFEIIPFDGSDAMRCNPRVLDMTFQEGGWYQLCPYTINLECDRLYPVDEDSFNPMLDDVGESWNIETQDAQNESNPHTYMVTHSVSAKGKRFYDETGALVKEAWRQAKDYVVAKLGFDSTMVVSSGVNNIPSFFSGYNHVRNEQIDEKAGSYSVTETWVLSSGSALESFTVQSSNKIDAGFITVTVNGDITGLEERNNNMQVTTSKYSNALSRFSIVSGLLLSRAQGYSGFNLNIYPLEESIGRNPIQGTINYTYTYDNRPCRIIPGVKSEKITVDDDLGGDVVGIIPVVGRVYGPVLQDIGTKTESKRRLIIEVVTNPKTGCFQSVTELRTFFTDNPRRNVVTGPYIQNIIDSVNPALIGVYRSFNTANTETWDGTRYTANIEWIYEN